MEIELLVQNVETGNILEISELVSSITWSTYLTEQPGKLTFDFIDKNNKVLTPEGTIVSLKVNQEKVFFGYVFKNATTNKLVNTITAYDQLRYLKNKDTYVFSNMTVTQIFEKICKDYNLKYKLLDVSSYKLPASIEDNKSLYEMIQKGIDLTLINAKTWCMVRDNFGTLEFTNINRLKTNIFIGDESLLSSYSYETSIDDDSFNQIKLVKENKKTKKREIYIVKDSSNMKKWGTLQYFETVNEDMNAAQIQSRAELLLTAKNRKTQTLKLDNVLGNLKVFAGCGVILGINSLQLKGLPMNKYFMVNSCTHTFRNSLHTMSLEMQVSI